MPTDWNKISDDEILNYDDAHTGNMARYERIMRYKTNVELKNVHLGLHDLKKGTMQSADKIEKALQNAEASSSKFQNVTIALTIVIVISTIVYTYITWQAVQVGKEANKIQKEMLLLQQEKPVEPSNKALKSQPSAAGTPLRGAP